MSQLTDRYANFGKLRFRSEEEQHIWSECSRLPIVVEEEVP